MELLERLNQDLKQAMKDKDKVRLSVVRMVKSATKNREIELGHPLSEEDILAVIQKELKQRKDSLQAFQDANRTDLITAVEEEIAVLEGYLPEPLSEDELRQIVSDVIVQVGAQSKADMGKVMGQLMPLVRGRADGKAVQQMVQSLLS
ncbi:GatB/YqeY domain-containing protein [Alicyclobacillus dauci]|uniref:GatB/YqeY domain-containing protein n=1 Tax=Alicyclobacillus dauci TaxID=1475485 RepID=A0ABY6Z6Y0_9BACL|nr:GatB/YqeY domain-containing protein [Alicyclobacillus dauci]WAH38544.1 GatB/YqeY domain-containing protein [Alicyclobacillus dauci]